ncbi:DMT family transporter [Natronomonas marina]|uniref:DMT family transporter n=1 Tax=Natronomonas marina TaxID=2961939 RepID=UPI0020C99813|nr:EamA family transporter [Natronomonas marina]
MSRLSATALFVTLATMWGLSFPAISVGLEYLPPLLFAAFRYDTAALLLLGYAVVATDSWRPVGRNNLEAVLWGGLFLVAGNGLLFIGQQTVSSGVAAILQALVPIVTALFALALLDERLSAVGSVGVALGFLGIGLIVQPDPNNLLAGDTVGRLIVLGQVVSVALGGVLVDRAAPSMERVAMTGWAMLVGGVVLHLLSLGAGERVPATLAAPPALGAVIYLGVFSTALAFLIYFTILEERGAFETSLVAYLVPLVATAAGIFLLGESVGLLSIVGFVVVFAGFALLKRHALVDLVAAGVS